MKDLYASRNWTLLHNTTYKVSFSLLFTLGSCREWYMRGKGIRHRDGRPELLSGMLGRPRDQTPERFLASQDFNAVAEDVEQSKDK